MRITKKFAGSSCIGKQVFSGGDIIINEAKRKEIQEELKALEKDFMSKIDYQHKVSYPEQAGAYAGPCHPAAAVPPPYIGHYPIDGSAHGHARAHAHRVGCHLPAQGRMPGFPPLYYGIPQLHPMHHRMIATSATAQPMLDSAPDANIRSMQAVGDLPHPFPPNYPFAPLIINGGGEVIHSIDSLAEMHAQSHNPQFVVRHPGHQQHPMFPVHNSGIIVVPSTTPSAPVLQDNHQQGASTLAHNLAAPYKPRQAHSSADLFGRQYPTTIEQMNFLSSENLRKKLTATNTMPSNGFYTGGRMGMGDAAKFCSAAAHAYSDKSQTDNVAKRKIESISSSTHRIDQGPSAVVARPDSDTVEAAFSPEKVDLEASDLLLNFFNAAGSSSTTGKKNDGSVSGSSGSGSTSNQGEQDGDDSVSNFSDVVDGDASVSVSGRSSSLSSDRSDNNSDIDYSSHDDTENVYKSDSYSPKSAPKEASSKDAQVKESYKPVIIEKSDQEPCKANIPRLP
jgi:hypothetical protein